MQTRGLGAPDSRLCRYMMNAYTAQARRDPQAAARAAEWAARLAQAEAKEQSSGKRTPPPLEDAE